MNNKSYYVSKDKNNKQTVYFEYDKIDGYSVKPKTHKSDSIEVSKIVFVNPEFSEKIIRKKIDSRINFLLKQLKLIEEDGGSDDGIIKKTLMDAEKLRMQIITNYVKYLGHTYGGLTLRKIQLIIDQLKYKLYERQMKNIYNQRNYYDEGHENRRGR